MMLRTIIATIATITISQLASEAANQPLPIQIIQMIHPENKKIVLYE